MSDIGGKSFDEWHAELQKALADATSAVQFIKPQDLALVNSIPPAAAALATAGQDLVGMANSVFAYTTGQELDFVDVDFTENYSPTIQDAVDNILEKTDVCLDLYSKFKNAPAVISGLESTGVLAPKSHHINVLRPQMKFKDVIDNSNTPFVPKIKVKQNAKVPLPSEISPEISTHLAGSLAIPHPYEYEISTYSSPSFLFASVHEIMYDDISNPVLWIDSLPALESLCATLATVTELAVDLEHHDYRSFQGITCLMQISTREDDYVIDTLELRNELYRLNDVFTNPNILKVFHGYTHI